MKSSERWQEVKEILYPALEMAAADRSSFLDEKCGNDNELRREIESLIAAHSKAAGRFESPAVEKMAAVVSNERAGGMVGRSLGQYEIIEKLGAGGMGEVYLARDTRLNRKVALKLLPSFFTQHPDRLRRFQQEARAASALNHPNILTIHEVGHLDSAHYIATEFVDGESLRDHMTRAPLKITEALDIATQVASALAAAHEAGIIHRDIKPENIMLRRDGIVKVVDFGLAKLTVRPTSESEDSTGVHTDEGIVMGTAQYMSPEQARGVKVDARSDIWSLGCVLYEMLAGRSPFEAATAGDVIVSVLEREPPPLTRSAPEIPSELDRIVKKALRKERDKRYQTGKELLSDLRGLKHRLEFEAEVERSGSPELRVTGAAGRVSDPLTATETNKQPVVRPTSSAEYLVTAIKRNRRVATFVLVVLVAAIGAATYFYYSSFGNPAIRSMGRADRTRIRSVAVLPFRPVSGGSTEEHVLLGLTDAVVTKLGSLKEIVVRPTRAVRRFATHDPVAAGRELSVDAVVEGSVQRDNGQMRVTIQLIGVDDGRLMWSGKFDERSTDMFALQDAISEQVALALQPRLTGDELTLLAKHYTTNPEAHYSYVRGRFSWNKRTANDLREAIGHFNEAIAKDPNYALAYAGLADSYSLLGDYAGALPRESYPLAKDAALKALELDDSLAEAHTSLAYANMYFYWDWQGAERGYRRAIALNPNYATAHQWYSEFLAAMGRFDEALAEIRRAKEIDPLAPVINAGEIWILYHARRYDEAIEQGKKLQEMRPEFAEVHEYLKRCYDQKGMYREAVAARQMRRKLAGVDPALTPAIKRAEAAKDHRSYWHARLEQEIDDSKTEPPYPFEMAEIYSQLGDKDKAFEWLEKAFEARVYLMMYLKVLPNLDPLRSDSRFADFLRRVGLNR